MCELHSPILPGFERLFGSKAMSSSPLKCLYALLEHSVNLSLFFIFVGEDFKTLSRRFSDARDQQEKAHFLSDRLQADLLKHSVCT